MSLIEEKIQMFKADGLDGDIQELDASFDTIFDDLEDGKKKAVQDTIACAALAGHITVDTFVDAQLILLRWEDVTDIERLALIEVYGGLNEMTKELDNLPTEPVRTAEELSEALENAIGVC